MTPRVKLPDHPPHPELVEALREEEEARARLARAQDKLNAELRTLSTKRGLMVRLAPDTVRSELKLREHVDA